MEYTSNNSSSTPCFNRKTLNSNCMELCSPNIDKNVHLDLYRQPTKCPVIWGNVYDNDGLPLRNYHVQLVKCEENCPNQSNILSQTKTGMDGYYELELPSCYKGKYRIVVCSGALSAKPACRCNNSICYF